MSVATLAEFLKIYGRDTLVTALQCVGDQSPDDSAPRLRLGHSGTPSSNSP